jgi:competence protein ComEC
MLVFVLIGKLIDRDAHSVSLLSFVALLMLIYNPLFINDVGFQLSFIVTFGIIVMAPPLAGVKNKILNFIVGTVSIPVIAQLWVIPIQVFYFSNISVYSVFANIMSVPILMVLSFGGFVSSLMSVISPIANFVCQVFDFVLNPLLTLLVNISNFWGSLPHSSLQTTHPSIFQILVYYGILLSITGLMHKEFREKYLKLLVQMLCSLIFVLLISLVPIRNSDLEITAFDVGNADCFLIKTPSNDYMLVDTAKSGYNGGKSQAEIVVLKYLRDRGIKKINSIIITHFDNDHCGGAVDLLNELKVDKVYVNSIDDESFAAKNIYRTAQKRGAELVLAEQEQQMYNKSGLVLTNYVYDDSKSENDSSIITLLRYNNFTMLFTGDAGIEALTALEYYLPPEITVLKVPHHGAIGSVNPELVDYFNPKYSLISVGDNKFGHPSIYTLEVLKGTKILRTDVKNSIKFRVNKNGSRVYMYKMKRHKYKEID